MLITEKRRFEAERRRERQTEQREGRCQGGGQAIHIGSSTRVCRRLPSSTETKEEENKEAKTAKLVEDGWASSVCVGVGAVLGLSGNSVGRSHFPFVNTVRGCCYLCSCDEQRNLETRVDVYKEGCANLQDMGCPVSQNVFGVWHKRF